MKRLMGSTDLEDSLGRLNKLTQEKAQMAPAELLKMTRSVDGKVMGVDDRTKSVEGKVQNVRDDVQDIRGDVKGVGDNVKGVDARVQGISNDVK
jgi:uncharacterized protein YoxC